jgi:hypothetical protein
MHSADSTLQRRARAAAGRGGSLSRPPRPMRLVLSCPLPGIASAFVLQLRRRKGVASLSAAERRRSSRCWYRRGSLPRREFTHPSTLSLTTQCPGRLERPGRNPSMWGYQCTLGTRIGAPERAGRCKRKFRHSPASEWPPPGVLSESFSGFPTEWHRACSVPPAYNQGRPISREV